MDGFIGRQQELRSLNRLLTGVEKGGRTGRPGKALLVRGRRRVGKSRLIAEFLNRSETPHLFFTAIGGSKDDDLTGFLTELSRSTLPDRDRYARYRPPASWDEAFTMLADNLPRDAPTVVVLDEMPYLVREDPSFEGALQKAFDRHLSELPVLLILVGSDIAMMERLNTYGRPFYQRGTEMVVPPLSPADVAELTGLDAPEAFDAFLVSGGLPLILEEWPDGADMWTYLEGALQDPTSALLVSGERALAAEFPSEAQARRVLSAIGHGERTFSNIGREAGDLQPTSLKRSLDLLTERGVVVAELPISTKSSRLTRYRVADPYLRFWLSFVGANIAAVERGGGSRVLEGVRGAWTSWRGRAIEPVVRDALWRLADDRLPAGSEVIGGYWTRTNDPEIDLVGADRGPVAKRITFVGSVKWLDRKPFDRRDLAALEAHRAQLPGATESTPLLAVSRSGCIAEGIEALTPEDLIAAWR
ncbi:ATP-binding protein [Glycomyces luteolus]|uniref:ATP-binding protein n=1 Tax=Glycomyces luteolus TaxID=2670330 RepID=A0A9X3P9E0_9ACTN|nr:ATP-binding protein [Glycomyces luteolus]MDA1360504.1 ATP-binding protein [Glycomyces luteolus]